VRPEFIEQPVDLPAAHAHQRRGVIDPRAAIGQADQNLKSRAPCGSSQSPSSAVTLSA
jgi:hypothetical protein